jgi:glutaredoxin-dependent peroxiredoxin
VTPLYPYPSPVPMAIQTGQPAPDFTLYTSEKKPWTLSEQNRPVVLYFFPGAFTSTCTDHLVTVSNTIDEYEDANAQVVGISTDAPGALAEFKKVHRIQFPLLSDHHAQVAERYGARFSPEQHNLGFDRVARRAAFVIDAEGTVRYVEILENPGNQPNYEAIVQILREVS